MNKINQIKALLGMEVKLETMKLVNGTEIEAEVFEAGAEVFIVQKKKGLLYLLESTNLKTEKFLL